MTDNPMGQNPFCCRQGCGKMSDFEVGFKIWASATHKAKVPESGVEMFLPVSACEAHSKDIKIAEWLHPEGRKLIADLFKSRGLKVPDFNTAELVLKPIKHGVG